MTAATYTSDLADIFMWESDADVTDFGGGGQASSVGVDYAVEGTNAVAKPTSASERGFLHDNTDNFTIGSSDHIFSWCVCSIPGLMDTRDDRGLVMCIGDSVSAFVKFHLQGGDTLPFGGIQPYAVRFVETSATALRTLVGTPSATPSQIGVGSNITGTAKFDNTAIDASRVGTGYDILNGTGADPEASFDGIAVDDASASEGIFVATDGGYRLQGKLRIGSSGTACEFLDENTSILIVDSIHSQTDFTEILLENASSILTLTNVVFKGLGTNNPGRLEVLTDTATITKNGGGFQDFGECVLGSNSSILGATWVSSGLVTANEANLAGSFFLTPTVAADDAAVLWNETLSASEIISELDDTTFEQGSNAHHAITFGTGVDEDITLTGITFNGFSSADDASGSVLEFLAVAATLNCNLVGCTVNGAPASATNLGVDTPDGGTTVTLVIDPVTVVVNVKDRLGNNLESARVFVETAATIASGEEFEGGVDTLTQSGGTATLDATGAHDLVTGDLVVIRDAQPDGYNRVATATVTSANGITYSVDSGLSTPASGTPILSYVAIQEVTNASGDANVTRTFGAAQDFKGFARLKGASSPFYKDADIAFTVDTANGNQVNAVLQPDE